MNSKEINQFIKFREKHGHYPHVIHKALSGGNVGDDIKDFFTKTLPGGFKDAADALKHGFDEFGNDLKTGFGVVGNFVINHKEIFISAIVTTGLMVLFPEFAPEIAMMGVQELLPKIMASMPGAATGVPTQADIDKAIAAYKADPRYKAMMDRCSNFIKNFSQFAKHDAPTTYTTGVQVGIIQNPVYNWSRPTSITMGTNAGDIVLFYQDSSGKNKCSPVQICLKTGGSQLMEYVVPIKNQDNPPAILNADGSNYKDLFSYMNSTLSHEQQAIQDNQNQHLAEGKAAAKAVDDKVILDSQQKQAIKEWIAKTKTPEYQAAEIADANMVALNHLDYPFIQKYKNFVPNTIDGLKTAISDGLKAIAGKKKYFKYFWDSQDKVKRKADYDANLSDTNDTIDKVQKIVDGFTDKLNALSGSGIKRKYKKKK